MRPVSLWPKEGAKGRQSATKLIERTVPRDSPVVYVHDAIARAHGRQSVRDQDDGVPAPQAFQCVNERCLGGIVERRGSLVEHEDIRSSV
jgi:hypothetical protein